jgi:hypothetical protein
MLDTADRINALVEKVEDLHNLADHIRAVMQGTLWDEFRYFEDVANELEELADEDPGEDDDGGDREGLPEEVKEACRDLANGLRDLTSDDTVDGLAGRASDFVSDEVDDLMKRAKVLIDIASML